MEMLGAFGDAAGPAVTTPSLLVLFAVARRHMLCSQLLARIVTAGTPGGGWKQVASSARVRSLCRLRKQVGLVVRMRPM